MEAFQIWLNGFRLLIKSLTSILERFEENMLFTKAVQVECACKFHYVQLIFELFLQYYININCHS